MIPERLDADDTFLSLADGTLFSGSAAISKESFIDGSHTASQFRSASPTICDVLPQSGGQTFLGRRYSVAPAQNPSACPADSSMDCYDIWVVAAFSDLALTGESSELWSTKVRVAVDNPKSTSASIHSITVLDVPRKSPVTPAMSTSADYPGNLMETPNVTGDGRLIVIDGGRGGLLYSYNDTSTYEECDARGWTDFSPISHMHYDNALQPAYGLADFPIRDSEGTEYADDAVVRGTYPWLDRSGNLIFYSQVGSANPTAAEGGWDFSAVSTAPEIGSLNTVLQNGGENGFPEDALRRSGQAGLSFFGLWSRGKLVHIDGRANRSSYTINFNQLSSAVTRAIAEYNEPGPPECGNPDICAEAQIALGEVREHGLYIEDLYGSGNDEIISDSRNTQIFSNENHFNYLPYFRTIDASDVTWQLHTERNVMELAFDDFVSPHVLINSSMVPTITAPGTTLGGFNIPFFHDGFLLTNPQDPEDELLGRTVSSFSADDARVQNAASAEGVVFGTNVTPPSYGELLGGVRIEPIAAGGIKGRGIFLDGDDDRVVYDIATTGVAADEPWYISMWLNAKDLEDEQSQPIQRELLHFPDGTIVQVKGTDRMRIKKGSFVRVILFPTDFYLEESYWRHLAIQVVPNRTGTWSGERTYIKVFVDGYAFYEEIMEQTYGGAAAPELFQLTDGKIILGWDPIRASTDGYRGWIDELEVIHGEIDPESACRHAYGTLSGVDINTDSASLVTKAGRFPQWAHADVNDLLTPSQEWDKYVCDVHYPETDALSGDLPGNSSIDKRCIDGLDRDTDDRCVGRFVIFPEGPLLWNAERPDSTTNGFCLSCHTTAETRETMDPDLVLAEDLGTEAWEDDRRQPVQPPQRIFGMIPSHFVGHMYDDEVEIWTDCFVLSSDGSPPADCPY
ncbi:MAG: hypothetical protein MI919_25690 [Holophagales bacterium]|nr:hypothetical protein [Holophagales bacterium]